MTFKILTSSLLGDYPKAVNASPLDKIDRLQTNEAPVDHFHYYKSVSSVYSSRIEGVDIDFDSYFKYKFLNVQFQPDYTRRVDDLYAAYDFSDEHRLNLENVKKAHAILSSSLLPEDHQGVLRTNPMFVLNRDDLIEYVAAGPALVKGEIAKLFHDIDTLIHAKLNPFEIFYYAAMLHLVFVKIHPFQDGNGRTARLIEKWFLIEKIGQTAAAVPLEKNYYSRHADYYTNIQKLGLEYGKLDYSKSLDFLLMTVEGIGSKIE